MFDAAHSATGRRVTIEGARFPVLFIKVPSSIHPVVQHTHDLHEIAFEAPIEDDVHRVCDGRFGAFVAAVPDMI